MSFQIFCGTDILSALAHRRRLLKCALAFLWELFWTESSFIFFWAFGDQGRDWNALTCHLASEVSISEHTSSASVVANAAHNLLACFQLCCEGANNRKRKHQKWNEYTETTVEWASLTSGAGLLDGSP